MPAPAMAGNPRITDPLTVFTNLSTNLPQWISEIRSLSEYASKKHAFFLAEYDRLLSNAQHNRKRIKSPSLHSLHTTDERSVEIVQVEADDTELLRPNLADINPFEPGNKCLFAQARRKRKPGSSVRSGASGPQKFRSKQMVIIYYDSYLQEQLETMVRNIGAARNELRKAKSASMASRGFQLPNFGRRKPVSSLGDIKSPVSTSGKSVAALDASDTETKFDLLAETTFSSSDRDLEAAQTLCETAAHQFLRDGDCNVELESAPRKLDAVLDIARAAVTRLATARKEKESTPEQDTAPADSDATLCESSSTKAVSAKLAPTTQSPYPLGLGTMEIEVDDGSDDDTSSVEVDIKKFRMARSAGLRA